MTAGRTVLITNIRLADYGGSEVVVRDLALGLLRRGYRPIVYSPTLGPVAEEIVARGVPVLDDLRRLGEAPDIIHAHHCIPAGEALIRFPDVPAIFVCHAFRHWLEAPAHFPQVGAYVAVDEACRDRLVQIEGIDPARVLMLHNAVDLSRIPPRPEALPGRPRRAAAFGKAAAVPELRVACERLGIAFEAFGNSESGFSATPEHELVKYDLVFASARAALEALCCGCAAIACDARGLAEMVTSENFAPLRLKNFGLRSLTKAISVEGLVQEIARYDAADAAAICDRARAEADLEKLLDRYEALYDEVLTGARRPVVTAEAHVQAVARFLHDYLPRKPADPRWPWLAEREALLQEIAGRDARIAALNAQAVMLQRSRLLKFGRWLRRLLGLPNPY
jgi:glycosyltransferase involved in cell wall biosynthesis